MAKMAVGLLPILNLSFLLILFLSCCCYVHTFGFETDPRKEFNGHAVVYPKLLSETKETIHFHSQKQKHDEKLTITFFAFDKDFTVDLYMNKYLFSPNYFEKHHEDGETKIHQPMEHENHCYYKGVDRNFDNSWAAVSLCNGISGVIFDGTELFYIQPDVSQNDDSRHFLFRSSDMVPKNLTCGTSDEMPSFKFPNEILRNKRSVVQHSPYKSNSKSRFVELVIVNDNKEFLKFNRSKKLIFGRSKQIANIVNGLYSSLNIFIALVGVIIWSEHDEIKLSTDGDVTLTNFLHYRRERLAVQHPNDNAQLITAITFDGGVVGKALKGPICTHNFSGGVNMDHSDLVGLVATTVAHELGHNFGMEHDTNKCKCPDTKCIMAPSSSSSSPNHWSSCSIEYLEQAYSRGMDYCLKNQPSDIIGSICGNGFMEEGEECDCGLSEFCDNYCCNATSCQLFLNATCATGECCDMKTCQVKKAAILCRDAESECDLPEFCNGVSEFCPSDVFRQNGVYCGNRRAHCYEGKCSSHTDQCKLLWGHAGKMSDPRCYEQNSNGNVNGNCGFFRLNQTYKACDRKDALCGMLHCTYLNEKLEFGMESAAILVRSYVDTRGKVYTCRAAIIDLGLHIVDPGLVPSGAKCGNGKMCVNQKCLSVDVVKGKGCSLNCSGNGVCNSNGNCHCSKGYGPPYCDSYGSGGSIDSGPASDSGGNYMVEVFVYVIFLGLVPFIIISVAIVYYLRPHFKTWWITKARKAKIKCRAKHSAQRNPQAPPKFNVDARNLRALEISAPIQQGSQVAAPTASVCLPGHNNSISNQACPQYSEIAPRPTTDRGHCRLSGKFMSSGSNVSPYMPTLHPVRQAPLPPASATVTGIQYSTSFSKRRLSIPTSRPNCPPPRPPPPKGDQLLDENSSLAERQVCSVNEADCTSSNYYDDCQSIEFLSNPVVAFHERKDSSHLLPHQAQTPAAVCPKQSDNQTNTNSSKCFPSKPPTCYKGNATNSSLVASLAQKFENQDSDKETDRSILVKGFKARPLPAIPSKPNV